MRSLPNAVVTKAYLSRGLRLWISGRLLLLIAGINPVRPSIQGMILLIVLTAALAFVDIRIRREAALIGNLGLSTATVVMLVVAPAIAGEVAIALISRLG